MHCDLDLGDMTLGQGHEGPSSHRQQLCDFFQIQRKGKKLWPRQDVDRVIPIYPQLCLQGEECNNDIFKSVDRSFKHF